MHALRVLSDAVNRVAIAACIACVLAMLSISFAGFFYMALTGQALSWTYSLARLFVPWIGMLSITVAFKSGEHVAMSALVRSVPLPAAHLLQWLSVIAVGIFAGLLLWYGWAFFIESNQTYMVSDRIQVHHRWVSACVPVTGLILLLHLPCGKRLLEAPHLDLAADETPAQAGER